MSLNMFLGPRGDPTEVDGPGSGASDKRIKIESPILNLVEFESIVAQPFTTVSTLKTTYKIQDALTQGGLKDVVKELCKQAKDMVRWTYDRL